MLLISENNINRDFIVIVHMKLGSLDTLYDEKLKFHLISGYSPQVEFFSHAGSNFICEIMEETLGTSNFIQ